MQVILLERIDKLGAPGSEVSVKRGYARNWLLPQGKAVLATEENRRNAKKEQVQITARDQAKKAEAEAVQQELDGKEVVLVRAAGESGQLYGSVRTQDIAEAIEQQLHIIISKKFVTLEEPVRSTGIFSVPVRLHPQVPVAVNINVAPSEEEAKRQALKREALKREALKREALKREALKSDQARQSKEQEENKKEARKETKSKKTTEEEKAQETETTEEITEETTEDANEEKESKETSKKNAKKADDTAKEKTAETTEEKSSKASAEKSDKQKKD